MLCRQVLDVGKAELIELADASLLARSVDLVDEDEDRLSSVPKHGGDLPVGIHETDLAVDDKEDDLRLFDGQLGLTAHEFKHAVVGVGLEAARVDNMEDMVVPGAVAILAVAGHAGHVLNDGEAGAGEPVEEPRLAHVGPADDGDQRDEGVGLFGEFALFVDEVGDIAFRLFVVVADAIVKLGNVVVSSLAAVEGVVLVVMFWELAHSSSPW